MAYFEQLFPKENFHIFTELCWFNSPSVYTFILQTKEIEDKMKTYGESALRNFSMDGPQSIYEFEGENYKDKEKVRNFHLIILGYLI